MTSGTGSKPPLTPARHQGRRGRHRPGPPDHLTEVDVAIVCEATYPFVTGGLSAVVHQFCSGMDQLRLGVIYIAWDSSDVLTPVYDLPGNVAWVHTVFASAAEYPELRNRGAKDIGLPRSQHKRLVRRLFQAIDVHRDGDDSQLWSLYDEGLNPLSRSFALWRVLASEEFLDAAIGYFGSDLPLSETLWRLRNFFGIATALTTQRFPKAKVYHTHTTGSAGLLAATAARQHGAKMLLTEHNLFTRDAINLLLQRSGSTVVTRDTWHELETYLGGDSIHPVERTVTRDQRAWMAWTTALGEIGYRAADRITYLYPEAIEEAAGLGSRPEISEVIANGIDTVPYLDGRAAFAERLPTLSEPGRVWRLAFAARVVVIKGLVDLIEAVAELTRRGVVNLTLDVMGPIEEEPAYVEECMDRIALYGLQDRIRFIGNVRIPVVLPAYDLLVLPSHNEGAPIIILEALSMGIPTLATRVGGVEAILARPTPDPEDPDVTIGPGGIVVRPGHVPGLADALQHLIAHPEEHATLARNAWQRADRLFHIDLTLDRYSDTLEALGVPQPVPDHGRRAILPHEEAGYPRAHERSKPRRTDPTGHNGP